LHVKDEQCGLSKVSHSIYQHISFHLKSPQNMLADVNLSGPKVMIVTYGELVNL
jgi:hypothetical protein